ncbi:hypothetical protein DERF_014349 [Dermatophagoides farinae]|uniref:Uncharacterized protein n=1 Tax=Dermatophagoides farinae TaxID=6954 RepID=A0A922HNW9_DERFA|nr:hypothetical protein DERF_014349 [Dermatophagoides farinae]
MAQDIYGTFLFVFFLFLNGKCAHSIHSPNGDEII